MARRARGSDAREPYDLVDARDRVIGVVTRRDAHQKGLRHRAVHVFLLDAQGRLFVQQRSSIKDTNPLKRGSSMGGHVDLGESYAEAAVREVSEELGLKITRHALRFVHTFSPAKDNWHEFASVYLVRYLPKRHGRIRLDKKEVASGQFMEIREIRRSLRLHPSGWTPDFARYFRWMLRNERQLLPV